MLIADFVLNWRAKDQRARLGRMFDHRKMSQAVFRSGGRLPSPFEVDLKKVIDAFAHLQVERYIADYDIGRVWLRVDVTNTLAIADNAFVVWKTIRKEKIAQDHLMTMFGARRV